MKTSRLLTGFLIGTLIICSGCNASSTQQSSTSGSSADTTISSSVETMGSSVEIGSSVESSSSISASTDDGWRRAYAACIRSDKYSDPTGAEYFDYALIYLDDDEIPELILSTPFAMGAEYVFTYHDGEAKEQIIYGTGSTYIPRTGLMENTHGRMGYYGDTVIKLENHEFKVLGEGTWIEEYDKDGNTIKVTSEWDGKDCTEEEYISSIEKLFPRKSGIDPEPWYSKSEMLSILETGHHKSYGHRYKIFNENVTWDEAWNTCRQEGGYLATITSVDEQMVISELLESEGVTDHVYYVGYKSFYWLDKDGSNLDERLTRGIWEYEYPGHGTQEADPGWRFETMKRPTVGILIYSDQTHKGYVFNGPADLLSEAPQYTGKMGFICEFD